MNDKKSFVSELQEISARANGEKKLRDTKYVKKLHKKIKQFMYENFTKEFLKQVAKEGNRELSSAFRYHYFPEIDYEKFICDVVDEIFPDEKFTIECYFHEETFSKMLVVTLAW